MCIYYNYKATGNVCVCVCVFLVVHVCELAHGSPFPQTLGWEPLLLINYQKYQQIPPACYQILLCVCLCVRSSSSHMHPLSCPAGCLAVSCSTESWKKDSIQRKTQAR